MQKYFILHFISLSRNLDEVVLSVFPRHYAWFSLESIGDNSAQPLVRLLPWVLKMWSIKWLFLLLIVFKKHNKNIQESFLEIFSFSYTVSLGFQKPERWHCGQIMCFSTGVNEELLRNTNQEAKPLPLISKLISFKLSIINYQHFSRFLRR